ncbi:VanZ family protein [Actinoplanes xinjiangensis]|uniref:VanZ family protein n=1 Tax=Actinoplanes xinjiangensis TaxID=512350 RepID=UPI00341B94C8
MPDLQTEIPAAPVLIPLVAVLMLTAWLKWRDRLLAAWAATFYLAGVIGVTLLPLQIATGVYANGTDWYGKANIIPLLTIDPVTFMLNIVLTLPFGFLLPMLRPIRGLAHIAALAFLFSATIEVVQLITNVTVSSGRLADVNDLIANTLGGAIGFLASRAVGRAFGGRLPMTAVGGQAEPMSARRS